MTSGDQVDDSGLDSMLNVLSNRYRRRLLVALLEHNPQEDDDPQTPDDVVLGNENLEELMVEMRHSHLPKLADEGFIEWSRESNAIRKGPKFEEIRPLLVLMANHADELPDDWV